MILFGIKKVSELTGIPPVTLRAWERRYEVITPVRAENKTRLYTQAHIDDLLWIKQIKKEKGVTVHQAMELLKVKKEQRELHPESFSLPQPVLDKYEACCTELFIALRAYNINEANRLIRLYFAMFDFEEVLHYIFKPILYQVGDAWEDGTLEVSQEHFISHFLERRILTFFQDIPETSLQKGKAVALCPPQEDHELGLLLFSLFLNRRGIDVLFLGQNIPTESLPPLLQVMHIKLVCITITVTKNIDQLLDMVTRLQAEDPKLNIIIGGAGAAHLPIELKPYHLQGDLEEWKQWFKTLG